MPSRVSERAHTSAVPIGSRVSHVRFFFEVGSLVASNFIKDPDASLPSLCQPNPESEIQPDPATPRDEAIIELGPPARSLMNSGAFIVTHTWLLRVERHRSCQRNLPLFARAGLRRFRALERKRVEDCSRRANHYSLTCYASPVRRRGPAVRVPSPAATTASKPNAPTMIHSNAPLPPSGSM